MGRLSQADSLRTEFGNDPRSPEIRWPGVLEDIHVAGRDANRSEFIETAARSTIAALVRKRQKRRDLAIINRRATRLNREAKDVLDHRVPL